MEKFMAICKSCNKDITKTMRVVKTDTGVDKYIYLDGDLKQWWGKICPVCHNEQCRKDQMEKSCLVCKKSFSTAKADQVVCSLKCRNIRKVMVAKERRQIKRS
jgi:predicted nucleic acid-binding Zn ribbon protein